MFYEFFEGKQKTHDFEMNLPKQAEFLPSDINQIFFLVEIDLASVRLF